MSTLTEKVAEFTKDPSFFQLVRLASCDLLRVAINKAKFDKLPDRVRANSSHADDELLGLVRFSLGKERTVYAFSSERSCIIGLQCLAKMEEFANQAFTSVVVTSVQLAEKVQEERATSLVLDFGANSEVHVAQEKFKEYERLLASVRLARVELLYVVEDKHGFAVSIEMEGKKYALAFLSYEDAEPTMAGLKSENPGCRLARNALRSLAENLYHSKFAGLVINPASDTQCIIKKGDMVRLAAVLELSMGSGVLARLRRLLPF